MKNKKSNIQIFLSHRFFRIKIILIVLITLYFPTTIKSVEERNVLPFYYLNSKALKLKLNLKNSKLCRVKLNEIVNYKKLDILDCYPINKKIYATIKKIHENNPKKNELNMMFVNDTNKIFFPELDDGKMIYTVKSMLFYKKTKTHEIELTDKNGGYYYFTYNPHQMLVIE